MDAGRHDAGPPPAFRRPFAKGPWSGLTGGLYCLTAPEPKILPDPTLSPEGTLDADHARRCAGGVLRRSEPSRLPEDRRPGPGRARPCRKSCGPRRGPGSPAARTRRSSWSSCRAARRTRTWSTSRWTPPPRSAASSSRSPRTSRASRSASTCRGSRPMMDKFAVIRSLVGCRGRARGRRSARPGTPAAESKQQGRPAEPRRGRLEAPGAGRRLGPAVRGLSPRMGHAPWADPGAPGYLGLAHAPVHPLSVRPTSRPCRSRA